MHQQKHLSFRKFDKNNQTQIMLKPLAIVIHDLYLQSIKFMCDNCEC